MTPRTLWEPPGDVWDTTQLGKFASLAAERTGRTFADYSQLWAWSVEDLEGFWSALWEFYDVPATGSRERVLTDSSMPFATWFPDVHLNYAEVMLRLAGRGDDDVVVRARSQSRADVTTTAAHLREQVASARAGLIRLGVVKNDRVAAYIPNIPEALVLMLACASLGAVYTACPPEFGVTNVIDRWSQIEPKVLIAVDGYVYGQRDIDRTGHVDEISEALGLQDRTVMLPYLVPEREVASPMIAWSDFLSDTTTPLAFDRVGFEHPLWILFSSGTTGLPKAIVHGHGGVTLELLKLQGLQHDLGPKDTYFWYSTTGWVMWNLQVSGLLVGSTIVMYDGNPGSRELGELWYTAIDFGATYFGVSAPFLMQCRKAGMVPRQLGDLSKIREIGSTGAPLPEEGFEWLYEQLGPKIRVNSTSGGTDVCTSFVGSAPVLPVRSGQIACRQLAVKVESWSPEGTPLTDEVGEMVVTAPMPSMPVGFWGDDTGEKYRAAYFEHWDGIWRHGDWITVAADGHCVISGRSDATLNRGGVRFGTSEFYRVVEELDDVADSLIVHLDSTGGDVGELILFVVPATGRTLDDDLRRQISTALRSKLSPRHVPDVIHQIDGVPRTLSGKKLEVPVKRILAGAAATDVADPAAVSNPSALTFFAELAQERKGQVTV
ncbi:acetoacetate--CoA ligase [Rhodococcus sp. 06-156-3C]|uniref:acetoacetate--CoA ligase n=1 Tax=Nocardiaceae TaxID=85025 RepID=UPI000522ECA8|nr:MULTISPECIES: acetoacetate--CoA ligase [Rhodococcus]OZD13078.1 acetoacetate--CoA ligase [Rhodococcus sp. 06-156-4a]OZD17947.1 acetoacetate--CoA ligase [Rhodococcus sp. 06-156-3C]OZD20671.1 acetoacetate--CoA ligase [Rhodococcus sp. 06-156-4C]OZD30611.1 acetoacetate--CoA ligase [Rhodococcus sp. 06-156-3b]OZD32617.1 acetoacetate--CoA ligase [Rhodococcus sp. 06-156-3]